MKKTHLLLTLVGFLVGVGAALATDNATKVMNYPIDLRQGLYVGSNAISKPQVRRISYGTLDYDFPATAGLNSAATQQICQSSGNVTVTGARFGDVCWVGVDQTVSALATYTAQVTAADTAIIQQCAVGVTDAGSVNQADSGWKVICLGTGS